MVPNDYQLIFATAIHLFPHSTKAFDVGSNQVGDSLRHRRVLGKHLVAGDLVSVVAFDAVRLKHVDFSVDYTDQLLLARNGKAVPRVVQKLCSLLEALNQADCPSVPGIQATRVSDSGCTFSWVGSDWLLILASPRHHWRCTRAGVSASA